MTELKSKLYRTWNHWAPLRWTAACSWVSAWPLFLQKKELISRLFSCDYPFKFSAVLRTTLQCRLQFPWLFAGSVGQLVESFPLATDCHSNRPRRRRKANLEKKRFSWKLLPKFKRTQTIICLLNQWLFLVKEMGCARFENMKSTVAWPRGLAI